MAYVQFILDTITYVDGAEYGKNIIVTEKITYISLRLKKIMESVEEPVPSSYARYYKTYAVISSMFNAQTEHVHKMMKMGLFTTEERAAHRDLVKNKSDEPPDDYKAELAKTTYAVDFAGTNAMLSLIGGTEEAKKLRERLMSESIESPPTKIQPALLETGEQKANMFKEKVILSDKLHEFMLIEENAPKYLAL